jgi:uncharacterized protein (DUF305 family)
MKKLTITITLLILIAIGFTVYKSYTDGSFMKKDEKDTAVMVKNFINMMIPHHEEAITSSMKVMNDLGITESKVRIFAANVVDAQTFEISKMKNIHAQYLGSGYVSTLTIPLVDEAKSKDGHYEHMMTDVTNLKGDELAKTYTKDMIKHHEMAIKEAKDFIKTIDKINKSNSNTENGLTILNSHPAVDEAYQIAKDIILTQTEEIVEMKTWFK